MEKQEQIYKKVAGIVKKIIRVLHKLDPHPMAALWALGDVYYQVAVMSGNVAKAQEHLLGIVKKFQNNQSLINNNGKLD